MEAEDLLEELTEVKQLLEGLEAQEEAAIETLRGVHDVTEVRLQDIRVQSLRAEGINFTRCGGSTRYGSRDPGFRLSTKCARCGVRGVSFRHKRWRQRGRRR